MSAFFLAKWCETCNSYSCKHIEQVSVKIFRKTDPDWNKIVTLFQKAQKQQKGNVTEVRK